jgi:hypothetical protein
MITGYNTDVEHGGVVYHVQTEDKGLQNPIILSLVYAGGEILASKRSAYQDLIRNGFIEAVLAERLQRQHKLICAAIHAGRISELKNMSHREIVPAAEPAEPKKPVAPLVPVQVWMPPVQRPKKAYSPRRTRIPLTPEEDPDSLKVKLIDEEEARAGDSVTLRVMVSKGLGDNQIAIRKARVSVRILGSTFRPMKASGITGKDGIAEVTVLVPQFNTGRAAMLVRAELEKEVAELRRVIQPAQRR